MLKIFVVVALASLGVSGLALGASRDDTYKLATDLRARSEVPKPTGVQGTRVRGIFTATAVEKANGSATITWRLTFSHLTGPASGAHIHLGKPGKAGPVAIPLCGPCKSGQRGTAKATKAQFKAIEAGGTYVNVHTAKNAAGEIRGQIKVSE